MRPGQPGTEPCAGIGMLAILPRPAGQRGKSRLPGSRLFQVSSLSAEAAGLLRPGTPRGARPLSAVA